MQFIYQFGIHLAAAAWVSLAYLLALMALLVPVALPTPAGET